MPTLSLVTSTRTYVHVHVHSVEFHTSVCAAKMVSIFPKIIFLYEAEHKNIGQLVSHQKENDCWAVGVTIFDIQVNAVYFVLMF